MTQQQVINEQALLQQLSAPLGDNEVEWRVQSVTNYNGLQALVVPYVTSRAAMQRLDDVFGIRWSSSQEPINVDGVAGFKCTITVKDENGVVITSRSDVAEPTDIERLKGGSSDAFKRAAVQFGVGRFLYALPKQFVAVYDKKPHGVESQYINGKFKINGQQQFIKGYFVKPSIQAILSNQSSPQKNNNQPQPQAKNNQPQQPQANNNQPSQMHTNNPNPNQPNEKEFSQAVGFLTEALRFFNMHEAIGEVFTLCGLRQVPSLSQATFADIQTVYEKVNPIKILFSKAFEMHLSDIQIFDFLSRAWNTQINSFTELFGKLTYQDVQRVLVDLKQAYGGQVPNNNRTA